MRKHKSARRPPPDVIAAAIAAAFKPKALLDDPRVQEGIRMVNEQSKLKVWEFAVTGCFMNELHAEHEPPTVKSDGVTITISEHLRFI